MGGCPPYPPRVFMVGALPPFFHPRQKNSSGGAAATTTRVLRFTAGFHLGPYQFIDVPTLVRFGV